MIRFLLAVLFTPVVALAQYPTKPVRMIIPFAPGGASDFVGRIMQPKMTELLGQQIVVENKPGAAGNIGAETAAKSAPDGYTIFLGNVGSVAINPGVYPKLSITPTKDLVAVTQVVDVPSVLIVHPSLPVNTMRELVDYAKASPGKLNYASPGSGSLDRLEMELLRKVASLDMVHVPYKGGAPALQDLAAGRIQAMILSVSLSAPQVRQGRLKALAIPGRARATRLPEVPSSAEAGYPQFEALLFSSLHAPAGTPLPVVERMSLEVEKAMRDAETRKRIEDLGAVPASSSPEEFARDLRGIEARWGRLIRSLDIRVD
jgi:tripartite-type tricarboxylate transporter receptor subunit TctC